MRRPSRFKDRTLRSSKTIHPGILKVYFRGGNLLLAGGLGDSFSMDRKSSKIIPFPMKKVEKTIREKWDEIQPVYETWYRVKFKQKPKDEQIEWLYQQYLKRIGKIA